MKTRTKVVHQNKSQGCHKMRQSYSRQIDKITKPFFRNYTLCDFNELWGQTSYNEKILYYFIMLAFIQNFIRSGLKQINKQIK